MSVAHVASNSIVTQDFSGGSGNLVLQPPTGLASGDLWTALIISDTDTSIGDIATPSGWTKEYDYRNNTNQWPRMWLFWKIAGSSESQVTFACDTGTYQVHGLSSRWSGTHQSDPISFVDRTTFYDGSTAPTSFDMPDATVANDGSMVVAHTSCQKSGGGAMAISMPSGMTTIYTRGGAGVYDKGGVAYLAQDTGTYATPNTTADVGAWRWDGVAFVISPPTGTYNDSVSESMSATDSQTTSTVFADSRTESGSLVDSQDATLQGSLTSVRVDRGRTMCRGMLRGLQ